jgi:hypothetical protein
MAIAARWMQVEPNAIVVIDTDFQADFLPNGDVQQLISLQMGGGLSRRTLWEELQRRNTLGPQFDPDVEEERLAEEPTALGMMGDHSHDSDGLDPSQEAGAVTREAA